MSFTQEVFGFDVVVGARQAKSGRSFEGGATSIIEAAN